MNAPSITIAAIHNKIKASTYTLLADGRTTICQLYLENGHTVIGKSACVCIENYNQALGEKFAFEDAVNSIWPLEGYLLQEQLYQNARGNKVNYVARETGTSYEGESFMEHAARVCHEVNRAYCEALGDTSQPSWDGAPEWQRASARMGVELHMMGNFGPEASHASWMKQKADEGWTYGPEKNPELKQHPCMVPFDKLPRSQQAKDYIFRAIVHALKGE